MKIVGINGSPRKNGNTYFLLKKTIEASKQESIADFFFLYPAAQPPSTNKSVPVI